MPYERSPHWLNVFGNIAHHIVGLLQAKRVLDAGCGMGFLVEGLLGPRCGSLGCRRVVVCNIASARRHTPYCVVGSITEALPGGRFDLVTCIEVLEHLIPADAETAIDRLCEAAETILLSSTPNDLNAPTHNNVRPILNWVQSFASRGFYPDLLFDAQFVAPHAMLLRRRAEALPPEALAFFARVLSERSLPEIAIGTRVGNPTGAPGSAAAVNALQTELDSLKAQSQADLAVVKAQVLSLEASLKSVQGGLKKILASLLQFAEAEGVLQNGTGLLHIEQDQRRTAAQVDSILNSRIWRSLQVAGGVILAAQKMTAPWKSLSRNVVHQAFTLTVHCDSPPAEPEHAVSGTIEVRGWAVAPSGVTKIEIQMGSEAPFSASYGLPRPDISRSFPLMTGAGKSGFVATVDTCVLPDGLHVLTVRAHSKSGETAEQRIPLLVDHQHGFANEYDRWLNQFERRDPKLIDLKLSLFEYQPQISIVLPVYKPPPGILELAIESVQAQSYSNWQLCLVDDGSQSGEITTILERYAAGDSRIEHQTIAESGGISAASNRGLAMAKGEYVGLLDHDDVLAQDALFYMVDALQQSPRPDLLYSDEDHLNEAGRRLDPFFKPDWSPDLVLSENYVCHFMVFARALAESVGGFRSDMDLSQDHDLLLRMSTKAKCIFHVSRILYHWRTYVESIERASAREQAAFASSRRAVESHLIESGSCARVEEGIYPGRWRVRYPIPQECVVSIIIPSGGNVDILQRNLKALFGRTTYAAYEIVIVDNSKANKISAYAQDLIKQGRPVRILDMRGQPFNFSKLNNAAVGQSSNPLVLFLNDDTEPITPDWLTALVEQATRPEVGAAGAKLLYPDGRIQHAGVTMGLAGQCGHSFKGLCGDQRYYFDFPDVIRNVSAVTGACLMTRTDLFREIGGFDETLFPGGLQRH